MNGGKRGAKRHYDYLHDEGIAKLPKAKSGDALEHLDPLPKSLVVRIKLRNGGMCEDCVTTIMRDLTEVVIVAVPPQSPRRTRNGLA